MYKTNIWFLYIYKTILKVTWLYYLIETRINNKNKEHNNKINKIITINRVLKTKVYKMK